MFDDIKCKYKLPHKEVQNETFQTKDFECLLETYEITGDGHLKRGNKKIPYHGVVTFYTALNNDYKDESKWYEYEAKFTDGKLVTVKRVKNNEKES